MSAITVTELRSLLTCDCETGRLFWLPRPRTMFTTDRLWKRWNTRYSGKEAFTTPSGQGYLQGDVQDQKYFAHRVVWAFKFGDWPADQIDHINGNRADNRIHNLRVVSHAENGRNQKRFRTNTSGVTGVYWHGKDKKWCARIKMNQRNVHLGSFDTVEDAVAARKAAEAEYGFHENHGAIR